VKRWREDFLDRLWIARVSTILPTAETPNASDLVWQRH